MPSATGTAITSASRLDSTDPKTRAATPNRPLVSGSHRRLDQKLALSCWRAGSALTTRNTPIAPRMAKTMTPASSVSQRKAASPRRVDLPPRRGTASAPGIMIAILPLLLLADRRARSANRADARLCLADQRLRQRREAQAVGLRLPVADGVLQEPLDGR